MLGGESVIVGLRVAVVEESVEALLAFGGSAAVEPRPGMLMAITTPMTPKRMAASTPVRVQCWAALSQIRRNMGQYWTPLPVEATTCR